MDCRFCCVRRAVHLRIPTPCGLADLCDPCYVASRGPPNRGVFGENLGVPADDDGVIVSPRDTGFHFESNRGRPA